MLGPKVVAVRWDAHGQLVHEVKLGEIAMLHGELGVVAPMLKVALWVKG